VGRLIAEKFLRRFGRPTIISIAPTTKEEVPMLKTLLLAGMMAGVLFATGTAEAAITAKEDQAAQFALAKSVVAGCLEWSLAHLDDHVSLANVIANDIVLSCNDWLVAMAKFDPQAACAPDDAACIAGRIEKFKKAITGIILQRRAADRYDPTHAPAQVTILRGGQHETGNPGDRQDRPTAECSDGWTSHSTNFQGTCSDHGGVAVWDDETMKEEANQWCDENPDLCADSHWAGIAGHGNHPKDEDDEQSTQDR
jgi:Protein of unknown function (DUF3761)